MKYNLNINQKRALDLGVNNINQAHIFDLLSVSQVWAKPEIVEGKVFYWVARQKICAELEILNMKPDTVYRHLTQLRKLGLINYITIRKKDLIQITELGKSYYVGNRSEKEENSEIDPSKLGNRSEFNSEIDPTYNTYNKTIIPTSNTKGGKFVVLAEHLKVFDNIWEEYQISCKKQNRNAGSKSEAKKAFVSMLNSKEVFLITESVFNYSQDCLLRNIYLKNLSSFLSCNKNYVEEWVNGSDNHKELLELKLKPVNSQNNGSRFESKSERMERDVNENREKINNALLDSSEIELPWLPTVNTKNRLS